MQYASTARSSGRSWSSTASQLGLPSAVHRSFTTGLHTRRSFGYMLDGATVTASGRSSARRDAAPAPPAPDGPSGDSRTPEDHRIGHKFLTLMGGRFTRDTLIYTIGMLAVGPFSLVSVAVLTRLMVPAQYGELAVLLFLAGYLTTLYNTGSLHGTFMLVYGASEGEGDDVDSDAAITSAPRRALGTGVVLTLMIVSAGTALCCVFAPTLSQMLLGRDSSAALVRWAAVSAAAGALWRLTVNVFRMERQPARFASFNALRPLFVVGGTIPLVALGFGVQGALAGTALGTLAATAVCIAMARHSYALAFSWSDAKEIVRRGAMVAIPVICLFIVHNADIVLLSHYASKSELGVYRVASRFAAVPSYFAGSFLMAWSPLEKGVLFQATYRHIGKERVHGAILTYYLLVAITIVVLLDVLAPGLVLIVGPAYRSAAPLIPLIGVGFVCYGLYIVLVRTVKVERRTLLYTTSALIASAVDIALSTVTIPWLGAYGAPVATISGLLVACALWTAVVRGLMKTSLNFEARPLAGLAGAVAIAALVQAVGLHLWPAGQAVVLALVLLSYLTAVLAFGVVPRRHFKPLARLARAAARKGNVSGQDPTSGLGRLDSWRRSLLTAIERDGVPTAVLAERLGRSEPELRRQYVGILRELIGAKAATSELDERLGAYLLSRQPEAQRDRIAQELVEDDADTFELMELNEAARRLRGLPREAWSAWAIETPSPRHRIKLKELVEHLAGLPEPDRRATLIALRDGLTPAQVAAQTGLSEQLVAARVVRVLRNVAHLGRGGPHDVAIGLALLGTRSSARRPVEARGVALVFDHVRRHPRWRWRRAGARALQ
jgi:O-antigen/teichoic acid export membrane protein